MDGLINDAKQIVCIVPKGTGQKLVEAVSRERGIYNANFSHARGVGRSAEVQERGVGEQREKDVFAVTVAADQADELFEYLFYQAELDVPHNGLMYMMAAPKTTVMTMPDIAPE